MAEKETIVQKFPDLGKTPEEIAARYADIFNSVYQKIAVSNLGHHISE